MPLVDEGLEVLDEDTCWHLLASLSIGRVGVTMGALPAIFPVNYAVDGRSILFRTGPGTKLRAALDRTVVAFEVDDTDPVYHGGWSVQAVGVAEVFDPQDDADSIPVVPWAPGQRATVVRIVPEFISGRRISHVVADES